MAPISSLNSTTLSTGTDGSLLTIATWELTDFWTGCFNCQYILFWLIDSSAFFSCNVKLGLVVHSWKFERSSISLILVTFFNEDSDQGKVEHFIDFGYLFQRRFRPGAKAERRRAGAKAEHGPKVLKAGGEDAPVTFQLLAILGDDDHVLENEVTSPASTTRRVTRKFGKDRQFRKKCFVRMERIRSKVSITTSNRTVWILKNWAWRWRIIATSKLTRTTQTSYAHWSKQLPWEKTERERFQTSVDKRNWTLFCFLAYCFLSWEDEHKRAKSILWATLGPQIKLITSPNSELFTLR